VAFGKDGTALRELRTLFHVGTIRGLTDGQLLERFATDRGEAAELAFAVLVERHGPMVLRVCRGVLVNPHDTQDAFQATFLVLVKKARGLWVHDSLGPWLHQVAYRTAICARSAAARRRRHERAAAALVKEHRAEPGDELARVLLEEIDRLPDRERLPVVLCDLDGQTHEQAARHLGWPVGTVKTRLTRSRERLRDRLARRGFAPNAGLLATETARTLVPPALVDSTTRAAVSLVSARMIVKGPATTLAREVLRAMSVTHWLKIGSITLASALTLGATVTGAHLFGQKETAGVEAQAEANPQANQAERDDDTPVSEVKPGPLRFTIAERGSVETSNNVDMFCRVEGQAVIISIVPEGSRVKKGQLVCELDSASLKDQLNTQMIIEKGAEAAYQNAKLAREVAEIAMIEYMEGIYKQDRQAAQGEIAAAQSAIQKAGERLDRTRNARKRLINALAPKGGAATAAEIVVELDVEDRIEATEQALLREKMALELAEARKNVLEKYTRPKTEMGLRVDVASKLSIQLAKRATWELEKSKVEKLNKQIVNCKYYAPSDGIIVYANDPSRRTGQAQPQIEEGATVRERQKLFSIPDLDAPMRVNTKVHESVVDRLVPGLRARITIDAFSGEELTGTVKEIAPLPDPSNSFTTNVKVYSTRVEIDQGLPGLRPGMTAHVEILVKELDNVLSVPFSAVVSYDGKEHLAVEKPGGGFDWREVTLGLGTDKLVEVKQGLKSGERVALNPIALMSEAEKREKKIGEPTKPAARKDADAPKPKAKGKARRGLPPALQKFLSLSPGERDQLRKASPDERDAILKKAGFTDAEIRQLNQIRQQPSAPEPRKE
jgi:HlyD family secretion protein